jgi:hypothetical protein
MSSTGPAVRDRLRRTRRSFWLARHPHHDSLSSPCPSKIAKRAVRIYRDAPDRGQRRCPNQWALDSARATLATSESAVILGSGSPPGNSHLRVLEDRSGQGVE